MKYLLFLIILLLSFSACKKEENVQELPSPLVLNSQETIDEYASILLKQDTLYGNVFLGTLPSRPDELIEIDSNITDLSALQNIKVILGNLLIGDGSRLKNLNDLASLQYVEGLSLGNDHIEKVYLPGLHYAGFISISGNATLEEIGFSALKRVKYYLSIQQNDHLKRIHDFISLENCGTINIGENRKLVSINDFSKLNWIDRDFLLELDAEDARINNAFQELEYVKNFEIRFQNEQANASLSWLPENLRLENMSVGGYITLDSLCVLKHLNLQASGSIGANSWIDNKTYTFEEIKRFCP